MIRELGPRVGCRFSFGVVPNWKGEWPLTAHPEYCRLVQQSSGDLLLHGYMHRRGRGWGPITLLTGGSDEMNGFDFEETRHVVECGQSVFRDAFGGAARGFLAPGWQPGHVQLGNAKALGLDHVMGFFSLESLAGRNVPLATWSWDCGRWGWLGHVGHAIGSLLQADHRVPVLAIHPCDLRRGFWPTILRLVGSLLETGYEPTTVSGLLETSVAEVGI